MGGYKDSNTSVDSSQNLVTTFANGVEVTIKFPQGTSNQEIAQARVVADTYLSRMARSFGGERSVRMPEYPQHESPSAGRVVKKRGQKTIPQAQQKPFTVPDISDLNFDQ